MIRGFRYLSLCGLLLLFFAGCDSNPPGTPTPAPTTAPVPTPIPTATEVIDPYAEIDRMQAALRNTSSYKLLEQQGQNEHVNITTTIEIQMPDNYHMVINWGGDISETTVIGTKRFDRKNGGPWGGSNAASTEVEGVFLSGIQKPVLSIEHTGHETLDSTEADIYTITFDYGETRTATQKVWISKDHLPRQSLIEVVFPTLAEDGSTQITHSVTKDTYYDFNTDIVIEEPVVR